MQKRDFSTNKLPKITGNDSTLSSKLYNLTGLRIFQAKFMEELRYPRPHQKNSQGLQTNNQNFSQTITNSPNIIIGTFSGKDKINQNNKEKLRQSKQQNKQVKLLTKPQKMKILNGRPKGLKNLGNTCYLNAVLQSLLALEQFNLALEQQIRLKKSEKSLAATYNKLANCYRTCREKDVLNPSDFKHYMGKRKDRFAGNSQQDSQQFLTAFLQGINEEMSRTKSKPKYRQMHGDPTKDTIKNIADQWWNYFKERDDSVVCDYFQGQIESTIVCSECNFQSVSFDNFWGLPVTFSQKNSNSNLSQLLLSSFRTENRLQDYRCQKCKKDKTCSKTIKIFRLPSILVIQIKRFGYGVRKQKIKERVTVPIDFSLKEVMSKESRQTQVNYRLRSTIQHSGELNFGHYTGHVYSQKQQKWFNADDDCIEQQDLDKDSPQLYVLFYCLK